MGVEVSDVEFVKARTDKREYRGIVLPNALEVLLISDPETDKAAASMDVRVGSFCDPEGLEGLAHFLEHMLFYASEKYPEEESYGKYITEHGGSTNATTSSESTNFYFDVNVDCSEEALDRFAQFFNKPLMSADATLREIKAVDSENKKNLLSDSCRMIQLEKHLSSKDHPYHKFSTGNWETLEIKPKEKGLDIRLELIKFYEESYSANLMHLVVYGKESLDNLQSLVESKFSDIRNIGREHFQFLGQPYSSEHLQILVKAVPITEGDVLRIKWQITPTLRYYKEGPCNYLSHLIGHEGEGSLFYVLKKLGWALSLVAGEAGANFEYSFFFVSIGLTDAGHEHIEDIIGLLFKYIRLLQNSRFPEWIFNEISAISKTQFHYQDKVPPISYVVSIASCMQFFPPEDWLVGGSLLSKFVPSRIQMILDELTPSKVRIFWESKKFDGSANLVEPWYGTPYSVEKVTPSMFQQWIEKAPNENLHLPKPNVFIPTDLTIKLVQEKVKVPIMLRKSSFSRLWYKPDTMFLTPKAYIIIDFNCPLANHTPDQEILTSLYVRLLLDYLNAFAYDADIAGLSYSIQQTVTGFQVRVAGFNDKLKILLDDIISQIEKFEVKLDRFSVLKESMTKEYQNYKFIQPCSQASYNCSMILEDQMWPWVENFEALSHLEADHLSEFAPKLLLRTFLEFYVAGNIEQSEAESIVKHIEDTLFNAPNSLCKPLFPSQYMSRRAVMLEKGLKYYHQTEGSNQKDENSALIQYIQTHQENVKLNVRLHLFSFVASQPAFHQLRTVEQLGYIVYLSTRNDYGVRGLEFVIQSTLKDPRHLDTRVDAFLTMFEKKIYEMPDAEFKRNVNALIDVKLEKFKNIWEESSFFWAEIWSGTLMFDRMEADVEALKKLTKEEFIDYFNQYIKVDAPKRKTLSVQVYGRNHYEEYKKIIQEEQSPKTYRIKDIFSFRRSRPLFSWSKGGSSHMEL
ncbi:insulin-degrading enzyme-like 1, peroxisomal isoform X2 [Ananas comosus]|uniref:Insulin-degrading enzyme-like 1, peroxisomal isoform X2 n=2 Tax=Ananas comosus TaxID=4615 RepID=A0A6P5F969_ANACO|nr:insulin-degrading enzyme-like 1, peroxisomal isoform X2 [Ananas comosus]